MKSGKWHRAPRQTALSHPLPTAMIRTWDREGQCIGGQKQRLCIARALLKRPKILILDDSTSAVDTATEARIRQCFNTSLKDTTKIIIAQRIGSVEEADRILVLDEGRLIGQGTHEQLMEECQAYQEIYYSQRDRKETAVS